MITVVSSYMILYIFCKFSHEVDRPTDQLTEQPTDRASYRGAMAQLKRKRRSMRGQQFCLLFVTFRFRNCFKIVFQTSKGLSNFSRLVGASLRMSIRRWVCIKVVSRSIMSFWKIMSAEIMTGIIDPRPPESDYLLVVFPALYHVQSGQIADMFRHCDCNCILKLPYFFPETKQRHIFPCKIGT